ncbi:MAG: glycosyltransferase [Planctomycetota bacterium]
MSDSTEFKTVSVVTPCYNAEEFIRETVESVIRNTAFEEGSACLQYIICDGGSTDRTLAIVERVFRSVDQDNIEVQIFSKRDSGMYEALSKGLRLCAGDVCCYINADDFYSPTAFEIVLDVLNKKRIKWLTGMHVCCNERSHLVSASTPFKYRPRLIRCGLYGRMLPFIQQESTFWHKSLSALLDLDELARFQYAGDYYMWNRFSQSEDLHIVEAWLGSFRHRRNQLSSQLDKYYREMDLVRERPSVVDYTQALVDKVLWKLPTHWKKRLNRRFLYSFDHQSQEYV